MFFYYKKILAIIVSFFYIFVNYNFYNSIYHEYTNDKIFHITLWLGIVEVFFWIMLLYSVFYLENKSISNDSNGKSRETNLFCIIFNKFNLCKYFTCYLAKFSVYERCCINSKFICFVFWWNKSLIYFFSNSIRFYCME